MSLLSAAGVSKSFPGVRALAEVDLDLGEGEVVALVGENGAGKSTLIKVLGGALVPDAGEVRLAGAPLPLGDPLEVRRRGVAVVHQELMLVPDLTAAENVFLGRERGSPLLRRADMRRAAGELLARLGARVDPAAPVRTLAVAQQQMVEIARALAVRSRVLILDEPTAALAGADVERLFAVVRALRAQGLGVLYISHRLEEVFALADRVTVLRDGRRVASAAVAGLDRGQLIRWMVGRDVSEEFPPRPSDRATASEPVLEVRGLHAPPRLLEASLDVRAGEIVGLAGLVGAGRTSLALALAGAMRAEGEVRLDGRPVRFRSPAEAVSAGVAYVSEDRKRRGLFPLMRASENVALGSLGTLTRTGSFSSGRVRAAAAAAAGDVGLRPGALDVPASALSGGNQQKLLLARSVMRPRRLLILDEPTRGVDVGAKAEIYGVMNQLTAKGLAILMISSELPEVLGMSDRVVVMHEGRTRGELPRAAATPEAVMALATGPAGA